jgi:hypothetical protein
MYKEDFYVLFRRDHLHVIRTMCTEMQDEVFPLEVVHMSVRSS